MATYNVKTTGTNVSGASADWTDAECYPSATTALLAAGDGDEVIFDDETHSISVAVASNRWDGSKTIKSRSGDADNCILQMTDATAIMFQMSATTSGGSNIFQNLTFISSVTRTANPLIQINNKTEDVTFTNCKFINITMQNASAAATGVILYNLNDDAGAGYTDRTITFTSCEFTNITADAVTSGGDYVIGIRHKGTGLMLFDDCTFDTIDIDGEGTSGSFGFVFMDQAGQLQIKGGTYSNITSGAPSTDKSNAAFFFCNNSSSTVTIQADDNGNPVTISNLSWLSGNPAGAFLDVQCDTTIKNVNATNVYVSKDGDSFGLGGVFTLRNTGNTYTVEDYTATNCRAQYGTVIYATNGATLTAKRVKATNCRSQQGVIYSGGDGDMTYEAIEISGSSEYPGTSSAGVAFYIHSNASARDKIVNIRNVTIVDNTQNSSTAFGLKINNDEANALTVNIDNSIFKNGGSSEIDATGTGTLTVTMDCCHVEGGESATVGVDTYSNEIATDPLLTSDYILGSNSPGKRAGKFIAHGSLDRRGRPRHIPPDIGAYESTSGDPADTRAIRS